MILCSKDIYPESIPLTVSSVVILSFSFFFFHSSFIQCYPLGSSYLVGKVLSIGI